MISRRVGALRKLKKLQVFNSALFNKSCLNQKNKNTTLKFNPKRDQ